MKSKLIKSIISFLDRIIPKKSNLVIFGARGGTMYYDNSKYLFEYMRDNHPELECVWLTLKPHICNRLNNQGYYTEGFKPRRKCELARTRRGIWTFLRAKFAVLSHGYADMGLYLSNSTPKKVIMLWHGLPIKNIMFASKGEKPKKPMKIDLFPVSSRLEKMIMSYCFEIPARKDVLKVWGTPRLDKMQSRIQKNQDSQRKRFLQEINVTNYPVEKIILYAPTYRSELTTKFFPFEYDKDKLNRLLDNNKAIILLRTHVSDKQAEFFDWSQHDRVIYWDQEKYPDLYDYLHLMDIVITDYSSLYFECLYLNVPMVFVPYDDYLYEEKWGFLTPYHHITTGYKVRDGKRFVHALSVYLTVGDHFIDGEERLKHLFHEVFDGKSCERIAGWIYYHMYPDRNLKIWKV